MVGGTRTPQTKYPQCWGMHGLHEEQQAVCNESCLHLNAIYIWTTLSTLEHCRRLSTVDIWRLSIFEQNCLHLNNTVYIWTLLTFEHCLQSTTEHCLHLNNTVYIWTLSTFEHCLHLNNAVYIWTTLSTFEQHCLHLNAERKEGPSIIETNGAC
jgi:hypothetical protein